MRISDWSSDVCSSDLRLAIRPRLHEEAVACGGVAVIGRIENLPLKIEATRLDGFQPGAEIRALLALDRFAGPGVDRSPFDEFRVLFDLENLDSPLCPPGANMPGSPPFLVRLRPPPP